MISIFLAVIGLALVCTASQARQEVNPEINASLQMFHISDSGASDILGTGLGLTLGRQIRSNDKYDLHVSLSFVQFSNTFEGASVKQRLIPVTLRAIKQMGTKTQTNRPYAGVGLGFVMMNTDIDGHSASQTDACVEFIGGIKFGARISAELKLLGGGRNGNTGVGLSIGSTF